MDKVSKVKRSFSPKNCRKKFKLQTKSVTVDSIGKIKMICVISKEIFQNDTNSNSKKLVFNESKKKQFIEI